MTWWAWMMLAVFGPGSFLAALLLPTFAYLLGKGQVAAWRARRGPATITPARPAPAAQPVSRAA